MSTSTGTLEYSLVQTLKNLNLLDYKNEILKIKEDLKNELQLFKQRKFSTCAFVLNHRRLFRSEVKDNSKVKQATCNASLGIDSRKVKKTFSVSTLSSAKKIRLIG